MSEIPEPVQQFARELAALAKKHGLWEITGEFRGGADYGWNHPVNFRWQHGRHGAEADGIRLWSTIPTYVTVSAANGKGGL